MTPEERAVVQAAIRQYRSEPLASVFSLPGSLGVAVQALIYACNECNTDTHRCGCGEVLRHGDADCGQTCIYVPSDMTCSECIYGDEDPRAWCDCREGEDETCKGPCRKRAHFPQHCPVLPAAEPEWRESTFLHILEGDSLRIGQDKAEVIGAYAILWHAHVESKRMMSGKWWDTITPHDHIEVRCVLDINNSGDYTKLSMSPDIPVEILCDAERAALLTLQTAFPGTSEVK